jgi:predicted flap endonuclease-1-like 5' DNA nuclease
MAKAEMKNAPRLEGWAIGVGAGLVGFGAAYVAAGVNAPGSVAIGVVLCLVVGLILGLPGPEAAAPAAEAPRPEARSAPKPEAVVAPAAVGVAPAAAAGAVRPAGLAEPRGGAPDDLKLIKGVGPKLEGMLHRMGYYHFHQIAAWTPAEVAWVDEHLEGFKGRVTRDHWVDQARALMSGARPA